MCAQALLLPDSTIYRPPTGEIRPGEICEAVVLADPDGDVTVDESAPGFSLRGIPSFVLVLAISDDYALVAPIGTADGTSDPRSFRQLVECDDGTGLWLRIPELDGIWDEPALAILSIVHTIHIRRLEDRRVTGMHPDARTVVQERTKQIFET
jgi:hypothetical protein